MRKNHGSDLPKEQTVLSDESQTKKKVLEAVDLVDSQIDVQAFQEKEPNPEKEEKNEEHFFESVERFLKKGTSLWQLIIAVILPLIVTPLIEFFQGKEGNELSRESNEISKSAVRIENSAHEARFGGGIDFIREIVFAIEEDENGKIEIPPSAHREIKVQFNSLYPYEILEGEQFKDKYFSRERAVLFNYLVDGNYIKNLSELIEDYNIERAFFYRVVDLDAKGFSGRYNLSESRFERSVVRNLGCVGCEWFAIEMVDCGVYNLELKLCDLKNSRFSSCYIRDSKFEFCNLYGSDFSFMGKGTFSSGSGLRDSEGEHSQRNMNSFKGSDLTNSNVTGANFSNSNMSYTILVGLKWDEANPPDFHNANLEGAEIDKRLKDLLEIQNGKGSTSKCIVID